MLGLYLSLSTITPLTKNGAIPTLQTMCGDTSLATFANCGQEGKPCVVEVWEGKKGIQPVVIKSEKPSRQKPVVKKTPNGAERILSIIDNLKECQYLRVRRLTPKECLRFMGVEDMYIDRMLQPYMHKGKSRKVSDYALYGRAGNSIVVNVLTALFTSLIEQYPDSFGD